jgi:hypothetical protein
VKYCAEVDPDEAEKEAREDGGPDIETFIQTIKTFEATALSSSPFASQEQTLPPVLYDITYRRLPVTFKNRKDGQDTTSALHDSDTLSKRDTFVSTYIHTTIAIC